MARCCNQTSNDPSRVEKPVCCRTEAGWQGLQWLAPAGHCCWWSPALLVWDTGDSYRLAITVPGDAHAVFKYWLELSSCLQLR
jgi:hypothetical protein